MRPLLFALCAAAALAPLAAPAAERKPFTAADIIAERDVSSPAVSPDGAWVAYLANVNDAEEDAQNTDLWMASWDGTRNLQLTRSEGSESQPRWSPDGRYLAFVTTREKPGADDDDLDAVRQVWLLDRQGGEAEQLTDFPGAVSEFAWSPDGKRLAVVAWDQDTRAQGDDDATPLPIVLDRYYFKEDYSGYVGPERKHLYLFDVATRKAERLTASPNDEVRPSWSPDGKLLAFMGRESADPDRDSQFTLFVTEPRAGAPLRKLTTFQGENGDSSWMANPQWSPDGKRIAFTAGGDPKLIYYATYRAFVIDAAGGTPRPLGAALDRNMTEPAWAPDGKSVYVMLEDDRNQHLARITLDGDRIERVLDGKREIYDFDMNDAGRIAVLKSDVTHPYEIFALDGTRLRPLSKQNDAWLATRTLASVEEIEFPSKDGTVIHGFVTKPPGWKKGQKYPAILKIHGGPVAQYANSFSTEWQVFASAGYVVIAANPRGSSGRGQDFAKAIYADWGNKDGEDVLAAVDHVVKAGIADPARLGVGGWSYGGILTNQVIARDNRFKAATSGAGIANAFTGYGTDMYIREYELELGTPWENPEVYQRVSYPFFHNDKITTPTLFLCGEKDFNVPLINSEQMYQALKSRGVDTRLVIYPDQYHGFDVPSYLQDRMQRYLDWYAKYL
jgi:dipeptidyl aminopeptidase/acylaminoacyl peptidase